MESREEKKMNYKIVDYTYEHLKDTFNPNICDIKIMAQIPLTEEELEKLCSNELTTMLLREEYTLCYMLENGDFMGRRYDYLAGIIYEKRLLKEDYGRTWHVYRIIRYRKGE